MTTYANNLCSLYAGVLALDTPQTHQRWIASKAIDWHGKQATITVALRFDDSCKNGHQTFTATANIRVKGARDDDTGGCIHGEIARYFPRLAPLLQWHLCSTDGPMHYEANTVQATDEDLCADPTVLREQLAARLPALLARFRAAMDSCGFQWVTP